MYKADRQLNSICETESAMFDAVSRIELSGLEIGLLVELFDGEFCA